MSRLDWSPILERAAEIVRSYSTPVTLRQLHYRLVAEGAVPNTSSAYKVLSRRTAEARRAGEFPSLADHTRAISRPRAFADLDHARRWIADHYRLDRTEGQRWGVYLGVEKATMSEQLWAWFSTYGWPIVALRGYSSQTLADDVADYVTRDGRPAVLIYAGDFDPTGEDVLRDFEERAGCFEKVARVALNAEQVEEFDLPPQPGKATDSRAAGFVARHGRLVQVELEALDPDALRQLYADALQDFMDTSTYEAVLDRERAERAELGGPTV